MRIGIDAKWYLSGPSSGRVVVKNLVDNIVRISSSDDVIVLFVLKIEEKLFNEIFYEQIVAKKVEIVSLSGKLNFILNIFSLQQKAIQFSVDTIVYQNFIPLFPSKNIKTIAYVHDFLFMDYPQYFSFFENVIYRLMKILVKKADFIITISNSEKERIAKHLKYKPEKIGVVYHGVSEKFKSYSESEKILVKQKYNLPDKFILYIGRINARKNIPILIDALANLDDKNVTLVLIGKKEHKTIDIDSLITKNSLESRVLTLGFLPEEDLVKILSASSIFCFPSFVEGFGLPPLEAMKTGTPVLTTRGTSLPEVCENSVFYFDYWDMSDLVKSLNILLNNSDLREDLKKKGEIQSMKFSWQRSANEILNILHNFRNGKNNTVS